MPLGSKHKGFSILDTKEETTRERSRAQEDKIAKEFGGKVQPNSGALAFGSMKADVRHDEFLFEGKTTKRLGFTITRKILRTLLRQAVATGKRPVLYITFEECKDMPANWVLLSSEDFKELLEEKLSTC